LISVEELNMEKLRWRAEILTDYMDSHTKEEHALIALEELVEDSTLSNSRGQSYLLELGYRPLTQ